MIMTKSKQFAVLIVLFLASPAMGQSSLLGPPPGLEASLRPDYLRRHLETFVDVLELDDGQQSILSTLFGDYETGMKDGAAQVRNTLTEFRRGGGPPDPDAHRLAQEEARQELKRVLEAMQPHSTGSQAGEIDAAKKAELGRIVAQMRGTAGGVQAEELEKIRSRLERHARDWRTQRRVVTEAFVGGIKSMLNERQMERWPQLDRQLTREQKLRLGRLAGENLNLLAVLASLQLDPPETEKLEPILSRYEIDLHESLVRRTQQIERGYEIQPEILAEQDVERAEKLADEHIARRKAVAAVNLEAVEQISNVLPFELRARFLLETRKRMFPRIYRPTLPERAYDRVLQMRLDEGTRASIDAAKRTLDVELQSMNRNLVELFHAKEPPELRRRLVRRWTNTRPEGTGTSDPEIRLREAFQQRNDIGWQYLDLLDAMITADQRDALERVLPGVRRQAGPQRPPMDLERARRAVRQLDR